MEHVLDLPKSSSRQVDDYQIEPYSVGIHLFDPTNVARKVDEMKMQQTVSNLYVLVGVSNDDREYRGIPISLYAREIFRRFNRSLPQLPLQGGAWQLGIDPADIRAGGYIGVRIEHQLDRSNLLPSIGALDLAAGIDRITDLSADAKGKSALLVISDFRVRDNAVEEALDRFRQFGEFKSGFSVLPDIDTWRSEASGHCVFSINLTAKFSDAFFDTIDGCGFSVAADKVAQPQHMAHFVRRVFYSPPKDTDDDGIYDYLDKCPNEGQGRIVDSIGCPRFDGVM